MPNAQTCLTPMALRLRRIQGNTWLAKWRATAAELIGATIEDTGLTIKEAATGDFLFAVDWQEDRLQVRERGVSFPYVFAGIDSALTFLDALLAAHVANQEREAPRQLRVA